MINLLMALFALLFLPISSLKEIQPKLCIHCKHFITDSKLGKFGKCSLFPKEKEKELYDLVTGVDVEYMYCYSIRDKDDLCGKEGKLFKKKYKKRELKT